MKARRFDTSTSKFQSLDPAAVSALDPYINDYGYARNRVTVGNDPSGEVINFAVGAVAGAVGGIVGGAVSGISYAATHQGDFSWQRLGAEVAGGAIGGAVTGGCIGVTAGIGAAVGCGAAGGALNEWVAGKLCGGVNWTSVVEGGLVGGASSGVLKGAGKELDIEPIGRKPTKIENVWKPGKIRSDTTKES